MNFYSQIRRDVYKELVCKIQGIKLIHTPCIYTYKNPEEMKKYLTTFILKNFLL